MGTERDTIDEDVERAFDLLQHYKGLLTSSRCDAADLQHALSQLEAVMRQWLRRAEPANDALISAVFAELGNRVAAETVLADADLWEARFACLQRLADSAFPSTLSTREVTAACQVELQHWRKLLPTVSRGSDGRRYLDHRDWDAANQVGSNWSDDIDQRPSRRGAALFLAAACDALASAAHRAGRPVSAAVRLAQRLRETPDWIHVEPLDAVVLLDEQRAAARDVEELIAELNIVAGADDRARGTPPESGRVLRNLVTRSVGAASLSAISAGDGSRPTDPALRLHHAVESIAGHISNIVQFGARYPSPAQGLMWLDQHARAGSEQAHGDEQQAAWRTTVVGLRKAVEEARDLWGDDRTTTGVHVDYMRTSRGGVKCGPLERATFHELVIALGRLILDPLDPGAIWENELGALNMQIGDRDSVRRQARLEVSRALESRPCWQTLTLGLQREFAEVAHGGEMPSSDVEPESSELAQRQSSMPNEGATGASHVPPPIPPLRFARRPDARQLCLEALANAPDGIPRHQDIADATGLELQTVKEAMPKLKSAGYVAKTDGVWRITPQGTDHLKRLRGE